MLNADKSDVMLIGTSAQLLAANHILEIVVAGANLKPVAAIKSLSVTLDSRLTFTPRVTAVFKACNYHIWALRHKRHLSTPDVANTLACSIVGARMTTANSILYGCVYVVNNQASTSAELIGTCSDAAAETYTCGAPSTVSSLAARRTSGDIQARRSHV